MSVDVRQLLIDFQKTEQYTQLRDFQKRRAKQEIDMCLLPVMHYMDIMKQEYSKGRASALEEDPIQGLIDELKLGAKKEQKHE
jgi:hypothetical protein